MQHSILVAEASSLEQLIHETPDDVGIESTAISVGVHVLLQVLIAEFEDEDEFALGVDDVVEADDVFVLELLHERDFADGG